MRPGDDRGRPDDQRKGADVTTTDTTVATEAPTEITLGSAARFLGTTEVELTLLSRRGVIPKIKRGPLPWVEATQRYIAYLRFPMVTADKGGKLIGKSATWVAKLAAGGLSSGGAYAIKSLEREATLYRPRQDQKARQSPPLCLTAFDLGAKRGCSLSQSWPWRATQLSPIFT
jgi:hypothetical protein